MKINTLQSFAIAALIGLSVVTAIANAQGFPGGRGQGRGGNRGAGDTVDTPGGAKRNPGVGSLVVSEPAIALERELPSLRSDLLLDSTQVEVWTGFERSVRDAAQA